MASINRAVHAHDKMVGFSPPPTVSTVALSANELCIPPASRKLFSSELDSQPSHAFDLFALVMMKLTPNLT